MDLLAFRSARSAPKEKRVPKAQDLPSRSVGITLTVKRLILILQQDDTQI
jgi:hypothetical protein